MRKENCERYHTISALVCVHTSVSIPRCPHETSFLEKDDFCTTRLKLMAYIIPVVQVQTNIPPCKPMNRNGQL